MKTISIMKSRKGVCIVEIHDQFRKERFNFLCSVDTVADIVKLNID